ncbi:hypothetical protein C7E17_26135, partial [Stenotrophomonas maltophilia]
KYADALQAKRQQALNAVLFAEARAVQQEVESKAGYIARLRARRREAAAAGKYADALQAKRQQALNAVLFAEARAVQQ